MTIPVVDVTVTPGNVPGTYGIGCTPSFDSETRMLRIGPGVFRLLKPLDEAGNELDDEVIFPGGEIVLPLEAIDVWIGYHRSTKQPNLLVNIGQGVDNFTYCPCYLVYLFGTAHKGEELMERFPAHILHHWRCSPRDRQRWSLTKHQNPPENMEDFRGEPAAVVIQAEMPEHIKASIGRQQAAETARHALSVLMRVPSEKWSDSQMREILMNLIRSNPDVDLPLELESKAPIVHR